MADITEVFKPGEERPLVVTLTALTGTLTIQAGATVTLTDSTGAVAGGINGAFVTGNDPSAAASVRAWYDLDTTGLPAGVYLLTFSVAVLGSDDLIRVRTPTVRVTITAPSILPDPGDVIGLLQSAGLTVPESADVAGALAAAVRDIEQQTNRVFASITEARRYSGMGQDYLELDPCQGVTLVELLDAAGSVIYAYPSAEYLTLPINATIKTGLKRAPWWVYPPSHFPFGVGNLRVTATFGEGITEDLFRAITEQAALILAPPLIRLATGGLMEWKEGEVMVRYHPQINQQLIDEWRAHVKQVCGHRHRWSL